MKARNRIKLFTYTLNIQIRDYVEIMRNQLRHSSSDSLPIKRDLRVVTSLSILVAVLMTVVSISGLLLPSVIYPTDELTTTFVPNDVVNLVIGLPILLSSMWLARRGKLLGLLLWPGALLYFLYNYIAYIVGIPVGFVTMAYLLTVLLSTYLTFDLLKNIDRELIQKRLVGSVSEKVAGWVLVVFGILFIFRAIGMIAQAFIDQMPFPLSELGVLIADIVLSTLWVAGGVLLLQRKPLGYVSGLGLLFAASMLFIGLIVFLLLQPILTNVPFALVDVVVVFVMGLVCFIPFGLFLRGVLSKG